MYYYSYDTLVGRITLLEADKQITNLYFGEKIDSDGCCVQSDTLKEAGRQLNEYFLGERKIFDLALKPQGTEFMIKVWDALCNIPYGSTASYKDISQVIGHPIAYRAVGLANHRNPLPIIIPCHRVIASNGSLCGYGGGVEIKKFLLELENRY